MKGSTTVRIGTGLTKLIKRVGDPVIVRQKVDGKWQNVVLFPSEFTLGRIPRLRIRRDTIATLRSIDVLRKQTAKQFK